MTLQRLSSEILFLLFTAESMKTQCTMGLMEQSNATWKRIMEAAKASPDTILYSLDVSKRLVYILRINQRVAKYVSSCVSFSFSGEAFVVGCPCFRRCLGRMHIHRCSSSFHTSAKGTYDVSSKKCRLGSDVCTCACLCVDAWTSVFPYLVFTQP